MSLLLLADAASFPHDKIKVLLYWLNGGKPYEVFDNVNQIVKDDLHNWRNAIIEPACGSERQMNFNTHCTTMVKKNFAMSADELNFAVFCIENVAEHLKLGGDEVYKLLTEPRGRVPIICIRSSVNTSSHARKYGITTCLSLMQWTIN